MSVATEGQILGEIAFLTGEPHTATAVAARSCSMVVVTPQVCRRGRRPARVWDRAQGFRLWRLLRRKRLLLMLRRWTLLILLLLLLKVVGRRRRPPLPVLQRRRRALLLLLLPERRRRSTAVAVAAAAHHRRHHRPSGELLAPAGASSSSLGHPRGWMHAWREGWAVWTSSGGVVAVHKSKLNSIERCPPSAKKKMFFFSR